MPRIGGMTVKQDISEKIERIIDAVKSAGYDPYSQLYGYLETGDTAYITRSDGARELITQIPKEELRQYVEAMAETQGAERV